MATRKSTELRDILGDCDLFFGLAEADLDSLAKIGVPRKWNRGETIYVADQPGEQLFVVIEGQVKAVATADDGREIVLRLFDSGEVFGELALLDGGPRTATMVATQPSELLVIERKDFMGLLQRRPEIAIELLAVVAGRLRSTTEQVTDTNFLEISSRLAKKLLELAESYPDQSDEGTTIRISQEELGNLVAATRVSVNMQLKEWEREGLLEVARGRVLLKDRDGLATKVTTS